MTPNPKRKKLLENYKVEKISSKQKYVANDELQRMEHIVPQNNKIPPGWLNDGHDVRLHKSLQEVHILVASCIMKRDLIRNFGANYWSDIRKILIWAYNVAITSCQSFLYHGLI